MMGNRNSQLALLQEELRHTRELVAEGYAPRNRQLELERSLADVQVAIADLNGNSLRGQRTIAELRQRALARQQEYRKEVGDRADRGHARSPVRCREVPGRQGRPASRTEIRSPASGQVVGLVVQTVGGGDRSRARS